MSKPKLRWGFLAAGAIAREVAEAVRTSDTGEIVAVAARDKSRAEHFADDFGIPAAYGNYEHLLADPAVELVYISTVHPYHAPWAIKALEAGKHVLCEKPLGLSHGEVNAVIEVARRHSAFFGEAFMYRFHPQTAALVQLIESGRLGIVRGVDVAFCYQVTGEELDRVMDQSVAGGALLDVGCYCTSMSALICRAAMGAGPALGEAIIAGRGRLDSTQGTDLSSVGVAQFPGGILCQWSCAVDIDSPNHVRVYGTQGWLEIPVPSWLPANRGPGLSKILLHPAGGPTEVIRVEATKSLFGYEVDGIARHIDDGEAPEITWAESIMNAQMLDEWLKAVGVAHRSRPIAEIVPGDLPIKRWWRASSGSDFSARFRSTKLLAVDRVRRRLMSRRRRSRRCQEFRRCG